MVDLRYHYHYTLIYQPHDGGGELQLPPSLIVQVKLLLSPTSLNPVLHS